MNGFSLPEGFFESIAAIDDDELMQRRSAVADVRSYIAGTTTTAAFTEATAYLEAIDREVIYRRATGRKGYRLPKSNAA